MQLVALCRKFAAVFLLGLVCNSASWGTVESESAHEVIARTTDQMLALVVDARSYYEEEPQRYYDGVAEILEPIMDFESFSRAVMGQYGSKKAYAALQTEEDRQLFIDRVARFSSVFQGSLIKTYGEGLLAFSGEKVEILSDKAADNARSVIVTQIIHNSGDEPFRIDYKLSLDEEGLWKLRNVLIQGVNIGKVYRNQFAAAAKKYEGDVDQVIENWSISE
jgi:phospholipid transport system substrate-binding protein